MPNLLDHAKAIATGGDAVRLAERREVRKELAALLASQQRFVAIQNQLRAIDTREAKAVASHEKTTDPLQSAMLQIEADVTDAILRDEPVGDEIANNRTALLGKIATANSKLEAEVDAMKSLRDRYKLDLRGSSGVDRKIQDLRNKLRGNLGDPELLTSQFVNRQAFKSANDRLINAEEQLRDASQIAEAEADSRGDELPSDFERQSQKQLSYWAAEQTEAAAIKEAVLEEKQRLRDRLEQE